MRRSIEILSFICIMAVLKNDEVKRMKAIVSVFAKDSKGITAYVTTLLAENEINILDISQTLMQEYFAMIMLVDLADCKLPFDALSQQLKDKGMERGLDIHVQRQDIFEAMHRI